MERTEIRLKADGLELAAELHVPQAGGPQPVVCICHGIPATPPDPTDRGYALLAQRFCEAGFITLIFNFRGTGKSEGNLDMAGWTRDLQGALDFLYARPEADTTHLCLLGFSGGAAVAVYTAARDHRVSAVAGCACPADFGVLRQREATADTIQRLRQIGVIKDKGFPPSVEEWEKAFESISPIKWIDRIAPRPLLLAHGTADELIPLEHARRLYDKAGDPKELRVIPGAGHRLRVDETAMAAVLDWLKARC